MENNNWPADYRAMHERAALLDFSARGKIALTGEDRTRWLHGMVTNDVKGLAPGQGCYCFVLDAQGHIVADCNVVAEPDRLIVDCDEALTEKLAAVFDRFIIMDQVELTVITAEIGTLAVAGPKAGELVALANHDLIAYPVPGGIWLWGVPALLASARERLLTLGAAPAGVEAYEVLRIERGLLRVGVDTDENTIANETGQLRAMHFNKGCYIGQEIVERVRSRGHVNRIFAGFRAASALRPGTYDAARITSVTHSPLLGNIALGYVRREFAEPGTQVTIGGTPAEVSALPFAIPD